ARRRLPRQGAAPGRDRARRRRAPVRPARAMLPGPARGNRGRSARRRVRHIRRARALLLLRGLDDRPARVRRARPARGWRARLRGEARHRGAADQRAARRRRGCRVGARVPRARRSRGVWRDPGRAGRPRAQRAAGAAALVLRRARARALCGGAARASCRASPPAAPGAGDGRDLPGAARCARAPRIPSARAGPAPLEAAARGDRGARVARDRGIRVSEIGARKQAHLDLCAHGDVEARGSTLLEEVQLLHEALPELSAADVDPGISLFGRRLSAPVYISGMTGGTERAGAINRALAAAAQKAGFGFGLGSQRAMWTDPALAASYRVRDEAPDVALLGNVGVVQARAFGPQAVAELVEAVGADALCVHLNPAQELVQDEGDRDFRGGLDTIAALVETLRVPVIAKETGCGFSPATLARLRATGVEWVDASGAGGTTWPGVEALRGSPRQRAVGAMLREWGIPTAASVAYARRAGFKTLASGGIRTAIDVARALALGACAAGMALPFLRAYELGGANAVSAFCDDLTEGIRALLLLSGAAHPEQLANAPRAIGPSLRSWLEIADGARG